jgi:uncharacterized membrane protein
LWAGAPSARAHSSPVGCTGSGLGILLFTDAPDVHIGDTLNYSITVFNGTGTGPVVCDAASIQAFVVTPDGTSHPITLVRTDLTSGQSDYYSNVVSYVVRAQDVRPDGTVRATASDTGVIHQNDTDSQGGGNQGVNTEVSLPCVALLVQCTGGIGENGLINFTGTVTNCGNNTLVGVTVTNFVNGGPVQVTFITNLLAGQIASFSGSWIPANPCSPSTGTFTAQGVDQFTSHPRTVTSTVATTCSDVLTPGIKVTKTCPIAPVSPGQLLTFSGSVSNTGNVTLTNIVVVNNQPVANTTVFTVASLAPGAITNFTASYLAPTNCSVSDALTATANSRCGAPVSDTASATCSITTAGAITVTEVCPVTAGIPGGISGFSGVVSNSGNITLNNVVVTSDRPAANTIVFTGTLAPGASANYSGSFTVPLNVCSVTTGVRATGTDSCGNTSVTNFASATCPITTAPAIAVTLACPLVQSTNGGLITYSGTVQNSGNITLTNIIVTDSQTSPATVLTVASLLPGASANFTAIFTAPINTCTVSSAVNVNANNTCNGLAVSNSASATCSLLTTPRIVVTQNCSLSPVSPGGVLNYSGSVSNAGNIALTNIVVTNDRTGVTPVFTTSILIPGATTNFTGSYTVPAGSACSITSTLTARGNDNCSGNVVTNAASATCSITGTPLVTVTLNCPATPVMTGNSITYSGTVSNSGNVALVNVTVVDNQASPATVLSLPSLAPGASANFTATFISPTDACSVSSTVTVRGSNSCSASIVTNIASATCTLLTAPRLVVTQNCPIIPASPGGILAYSGTISNAGNITLTNVTLMNNQHAPTTNNGPMNFGTVDTVGGTVVNRFAIGTNFDGLTYAGEDHGYGATEFYLMRKALGGTSFFDTIIPSTGTVTDRFDATTRTFNALTYAAPDVGYGPLLFYYISQDSSGASTFGSTTPGGVVGVTADHFVLGSHFDALTFSATDVGYGANLFYYVRHDASGLSTFGTINPALPGTVTDRFTVGNNVDALVFTASTAPGYGANNFYYLRHDANGVSTLGTIFVTGLTTGTVTDRLNVGTNATELSFTTTDVGFGPNLFYVLRGGSSTASPDIQTVLTVPFLAPGASTNFTGSYIVPSTNTCSVTTVISVTGVDFCSGNMITNTITNTCPLATTPSIAVSLLCPGGVTAPGGLITYTGSVSNSGNVTLNGVTVVNNQASPATVLTVPSLAPGATANFTASFTAPLNACAVTSTVIARGTNACNLVAVTNSASATCSLGTAPSIAITENCPAIPTSPGGTLIFSGTVRNTGNITLTNVIVRSDRTGGTTLLVVPSLAAGSVANYTGSYSVPLDNACSSTSLVTATGNDICAGTAVTNTASVNCPIIGSPRLVVTQTCPAVQVAPGSLLTFSGIVSNAGNVTLTNVVVTDDRVGVTPILTVAILAPRATANFTGTYLTHKDCCVDSSTVTASGRDCNGTLAIDTDTRTCTLLTRPAIFVTRVCSPETWKLLGPGDTMTYSGIVSNAGDITLVNVTVVANTPTNNTPVFGPITLAAGEFANYTTSFVIPADFCGTTTVTARGLDLCTQLPVTTNATSSCPVTTAPSIAVTKNCPALPTPPGGMVVFTGNVRNTGNVTLTNVYVVNDQPTNNTPVIGPITLTPGASTSFSGSYKACPKDCCEIVDTLSARGQDRCSGTLVAATATQVCPLLTTPRLAVIEQCPTTTVPIGGLYQYTGSVTNTGNIVLTNVFVVSSQPAADTVILGPIELAPGESEVFSGSFTLAANNPNLVVTASGQDVCQARGITASANCSGPIGQTNSPGTNVFTPVAGTFNGLFFQPDDVHIGNSGSFSLIMAASGNYKATIMNKGKKYSMTGAFNSDGQAMNIIPRKGTTSLTINWQGSFIDSDYLSGTVTDGANVAQLDGGRDVFNAGNLAPQAGHYTMIIPGIDAAVNSPAGDGYATMTVDTGGLVTLKGLLADNTVIASKATLSKQGEWPVYVSLYNNTGLLIGWMQFVDDGTNDISGTMRWLKPNIPTSKLYKSGFEVDSDAIGSHYAVPTGNASVLQITDGLVLFTGGNLPDSSNNVSFGPSSQFVNHGTNTLKMTFKAATGVFSGTFKETGTATTFILKGAVLQRQNNGSGYAPGATQSGHVLFEAAP